MTGFSEAWSMWTTCVTSDSDPAASIDPSLEAYRGDDESILRSNTRMAKVGHEDAVDADYHVGEEIGRGGMGVVYSATQISLQRVVAVKVLRPEYTKDPLARNRFFAEAIITAELEHPNILPIYDIGLTTDNVPFYAMKLVKGSAWSTQIRGASLDDNLDVLLRVSDALKLAHSRDIIHRDLKPGNVMLGDFGEVLLMDWGVAATVGMRHGHRITKRSVCAGTPSYMPPEVALAEVDKIGTPSDIYLLGAILFEIVTGTRIRDKMPTRECLEAASKNYIQQTDASGELLHIAMRAMSTAPDERHASVTEFQNDVRDYFTHLDSLSLTEEASRRFQALTQTDRLEVYGECNAIIALNMQALERWPENKIAADGLVNARQVLIDIALSRGEIIIARSQTKLLDEERERYRLSGAAPDRVVDEIKQTIKLKDDSIGRPALAEETSDGTGRFADYLSTVIKEWVTFIASAVWIGLVIVAVLSLALLIFLILVPPAFALIDVIRGMM